jgi:hypothetical protein
MIIPTEVNLEWFALSPTDFMTLNGLAIGIVKQHRLHMRGFAFTEAFFQASLIGSIFEELFRQLLNFERALIR